jgi:hypothetical protein
MIFLAGSSTWDSMKTMRKLLLGILGLLLLWSGGACRAGEVSGRAKEFHERLGRLNREADYLEMEAWAFEKAPGAGQRENRVREAVWVMTNPGGTYAEGREIWAERLLARLEKECGGEWWAWLAAGDLLSDLVGRGEIVDGIFQRSGNGDYLARESDTARARQAYLKAMSMTTAPEHLAEIYVGLAATFEFDTGAAVGKLTDLGAVPEISGKEEAGRWSWRGDDSLVDGRSPVIGEDGAWRLPVLRAHFEDAVTDCERFIWLLSEAMRLSPVHAPEAKLKLAQMWRELLDVRNVAWAGYVYIDGTESATDPNAKGEFELHTLKDEETFMIGPKGVERRTIPESGRYVTLLRELAGDAATPAEVWDEAVWDLLEVLADRCQFDQAAAVAGQALKRDPGHDEAERMLAWLGPEARFLEAGPFATGDEVVVEFLSRGVAHQKFELWKLDVEKYAAGGETPRLENGGTGHMDQEDLTKYQAFFNRVTEWTEPISMRGNRMQSRSRVKLPITEAGHYLVTARIGEAWTTLQIQVSRTLVLSVGLESYREDEDGDWGSSGNPNLFLIDALTGKPVEGASVLEVGAGEVVISDHTGYLLGMDGDDGLLVRRAGGPPELLWVSGLKLDGMDEQEVRSMLVTNQPLYRPGQKVDYAGWLRRPNWRKASSGALDEGTRVKVRVIDPVGQTIHETEWPLDEFGGFSGGFTLPSEMVLGDCTVDLLYSVNDDPFPAINREGERWVTLQNGPWERKWGIRVGEFRKPDFEVEVLDSGNHGQNPHEISTTVKATYLSGEPMKGAAVKALLQANPGKSEVTPAAEWDDLYGEGYGWCLPDAEWCEGWKSWGIRRDKYADDDSFPSDHEIEVEATGVTDDEGKATLVFDTDLPGLDRYDYDCSVRVGVQEFTGRSVGAKSEFYHTKRTNEVYAQPGKGFYRPGEAVEVSLWTLSGEGKPVQGRGSLVVEANEGKDGFKQVATFDVQTDEKGTSRVKFIPPGAGRYRCLFESGGGRRGFVLHVVGDGAGPVDGVELIPAKTVGSPGEELEVLMLTADAEALVWFFEQMPDGRRRTPRLIGTKDHTAVVKLPLSAAGVPNFFLTAGTVSKGRLKTTTCRIVMPPANTKLTLDMDLKPGTREPGERAEVEIGVRDSSGKPAEASLAITAYDRALEDLSGRLPKAGTHMRDEFSAADGPYTSQDDAAWRHDTAFVELGQPGCFFERGDLMGDPRWQPASRFERVGLYLWQGYEPPELPNSVGSSASFASFPMTPATPGLYARSRGTEADLSDAEKTGMSGVKLRKNFTDRACWGAALKTDGSGKTQVSFDLPDNPTSWRVQSWAFGKGSQYGDAELEIPVTKSLLLRPLLPQAAVVGDEIEVGAMVTNSTGSEREIHVTMEASDIAGEARKVTLAAGEEAHVKWKVKVAQVGPLLFRFRARSNDGSLSDGAEMPLPVGPRLAAVTVSARAGMSGRDTEARAAMTFDEAVPAGTLLQVRIEGNPAASAFAVLPDLVAYPYGCTEQTLNRFLPLLVARQSADELGLDWKSMRQVLVGQGHDASLGWASGRIAMELKPVDLSEEKTKDMIHVGLARLAELQADNGTWGWFSAEDTGSAPYMTALAVRGLAKARQLGFKREHDPAERGASWLNDWSLRRARVVAEDPRQADALDAWVVCALTDAAVVTKKADSSEAGSKGAAELRKALLAAEKQLPLTGLIHLALSLDPSAAKADQQRLIEAIRREMSEEKKGGYQWWEESVEQRAWYLKLLVKAGADQAEIEREIRRLVDQRSDGVRWSSTKNSALCVEAILEAAIASGDARVMGGEEMEVSVNASGQEQKVTLNAGNLWTSRIDFPVTAEIGVGSSLPVVASRVGDQPVQLLSTLTYQSSSPARMGAINRGMRVEREYFRIHGEGKKSRLEEGAKLRVGELVEVTLKIRGDGAMNHVHLRDPLPAGLEPLVPLSGYERDAYRENRTGESHFFLSRLSVWNGEQSYFLRAVTPGKAIALPARAECMYRPEVFGQDEVRVIEIE